MLKQLHTGLLSDTEQGIQYASAEVHHAVSNTQENIHYSGELIKGKVKNAIHNAESLINQTKDTLVSDTQNIGDAVEKDMGEGKHKIQGDSNESPISIGKIRLQVLQC